MGLTFRNSFTIGFLAAAAALGFAYYLQYGQGLEPCPLCIFQRVAMAAAGLAFLVGALHSPLGGGRWGYVLLVWIGAGAGIALAGRHLWIQSLPADQVPTCGPGLEYMLQVMPLTEVFSTVLSGDGQCAEVSWMFLGLSLPGWTLVGFALLALWALMAVFLAPTRIRYNSSL